jgi:hypothetical protein
MGLHDRLTNNLINPDEQFKKAVEQGQIELTDWEKDLFDAAPKVDVDTSSQDNKGINLNLWDALDTLNDFALSLPRTPEQKLAGQLTGGFGGDNQGLKDAGESVNEAADTAKKTVKNFLPEDIGKNLGLALYGIIAVLGIGVFLYILSALKPLFEIGSNVSDK